MSNFLNNTSLPRYTTIEKSVGETPLVALERVRTKLGISSEIPLAYAGRLDPMASGKLLILIGDECKVQEKYHAFDKEYQVEILLGASSDSGDVLGLITPSPQVTISRENVLHILKEHIGKIALPYPKFSSKTIKGKPLHTWTLENRLDEIEIPIKESTVHALTFVNLRTISKTELLHTVREKIETIPEVTDVRKALGADFRRDLVRESWATFEQKPQESYQILTIICTASSGTYMRSLSEKIALELNTTGLAYSIHRTKIGRYKSFGKKWGFWLKQF